MGDEILARVEMLERIIIAMCSGQHFTISLNKDGRPQLFTELPTSLVPGAVSVNAVRPTTQATKEDGT